MKIILLLVVFVVFVVLNCKNCFAQSTDNLNKQRQDLRITPHEQIRGEEDSIAYKLKLDNHKLQINTPNGLKPNEQQIKIMKSTIVDDFLVNDDAGSADQFVPSISMDAAGNFVIVWYDFRNDNWDIYFQRYTSTGAALGVNTIVNDDTVDASQERPSISMDAAGSFVIVWGDNRNGNLDIYLQRYTSTGAALGVNIKVNNDIDSVKHWDPSISMDAAGNFVVVWEDERNGDSDIYFQRYTSTGAALGVNTKVNDDATTADQHSPTIIMDVTGNFVITWHDFRNVDWDIYFQRYTSIGGVLGVNTKVNDDPVAAFQVVPTIAQDAAGNFVIVWSDYRNDNYDIYFQRFTSTGSALGANIKVNDDAGSMHQKLPSISMVGVGDFVIVWQDNRYGQLNPDIFGQRYFANGNPNGANYRIVADGPNKGETTPAVIADNSNIIFTWQDNRRPEKWDIYAKIVDWNWNGVITSIDEENDQNIPQHFTLEQNYPNPFNPTTKIKYTIPTVGNENFRSVQIKVYDILGNEITTLVNEPKQPGSYEVEFDADQLRKELSSGVYFYQLKYGDFINSRKMILLK